MWRHNGGFPSIHWKRRAKYKMATTIENDSDYFLQENPYPISTFHQLFDAERQGHYCKGTKMSNTYFLFESVVIWSLNLQKMRSSSLDLFTGCVGLHTLTDKCIDS